MTSVRAVLTYHSLDESGSVISVSPGAFRSHVRWLASSAVRVLPLDELWAEVRSGADAGDAVAITFDDGFANFATHGVPVLEEFGMPSTLFVVSQRAGTDNAWRGEPDAGIPVLPLLDWTTIAQLSTRGVQIGGHTRSHPSLDLLDDAAVEREVVGSADDIEQQTGIRPTAFAYPYGSLSRTARLSVSRTYALGVTTELRWLDPDDDAMILPRLDAYYLRHESGLSDWGSPRFRARVRFRAGLRAVRARLRGRPARDTRPSSLGTT